MTKLVRRLHGRIVREFDRLHPRAIAWNLKYRGVPARRIITLLGDSLKVRIWSHDIIARSIYVHRYFEPALCRFATNFLKPGMVFIDAGANLGQYTLLAAQRVGLGGAVHSFEPNLRMFGELKFNVQLNGLQDTCVLNQLALSDKPGVAMLSRYTLGKEVFGSLGDPKRYPSEIIGYDEVRVSTLDAYIAEKGISHVDLIKMDIEGAELPALRGGRELLSRPDSPALVIEIADENTSGFGYKGVEIWSHLESLSYRLYNVGRKGQIGERAVKPADFAKAQNLVAIKDVS